MHSAITFRENKHYRKKICKAKFHMIIFSTKRNSVNFTFGLCTCIFASNAKKNMENDQILSCAFPKCSMFLS